ncbi:haloacid dehalogenase [Chromatiales bacterium (ex Bugula neritina AB1)]|nr:haloacid dehalogenase [Chromatiales bacterium (ex Bugula neritina AB1)]
MVHHVMFDVDDTLVLSDEFDQNCFVEAVYEILGHKLDTEWIRYTHVTDAGILDQHINENGLQTKQKEIHTAVKRVFTEKIASYLRKNPAQQMPGAPAFIAELRQLENLSISIATGGWQETALMKLESAEIDVSGIPIASSNDHFSRTDIMKIAEHKATGAINAQCSYFGDGEWDKKACEELGYNFVLVGSKACHTQSIPDFRNRERALKYIGL